MSDMVMRLTVDVSGRKDIPDLSTPEAQHKMLAEIGLPVPVQNYPDFGLTTKVEKSADGKTLIISARTPIPHEADNFIGHTLIKNQVLKTLPEELKQMCKKIDVTFEK